MFEEGNKEKGVELERVGKLHPYLRVDCDANMKRYVVIFQTEMHRNEEIV